MPVGQQNTFLIRFKFTDLDLGKTCDCFWENGCIGYRDVLCRILNNHFRYRISSNGLTSTGVRTAASLLHAATVTEIAQEPKDVSEGLFLSLYTPLNFFTHDWLGIYFCFPLVIFPIIMFIPAKHIMPVNMKARDGPVLLYMTNVEAAINIVKYIPEAKSVLITGIS